MKIEKKNLPESVYSRLKNIAFAKNRPIRKFLDIMRWRDFYIA